MKQYRRKCRWIIASIITTLFLSNNTFAQITQDGGAGNVTENYVLDKDNTNLLTINKPAVSIGDIMIANISALTHASGNNGYGATCPGWITLSYQDYEQAADQHTATVLYRLVDGSEGSSFTFTIGVNGTNCHGAGAIIAFSCVDNTSPIDVKGSYSYNTIKSTLVTTNPITTGSHSGDAVLMLVGAFDNALSVGPYTGSPTLSTLYSYAESPTDIAGTVGVGAAYNVNSNTTTSNEAAILGQKEQWAAILIALKPSQQITVGSPSSNPTLCINTPLSPNITIATTGATGIGTPSGLPAGVTATWTGSSPSGTITISGTPTASGTFNYSIPLIGGCGSVNATGTITVTPTNTAGPPSSTPTLCRNTPLTAITITTTGATGISNSGVSGANGLPAGVSATWASNTITISGTPTASGTFNYSIPLTGGCGNVSATGRITVTPLPLTSPIYHY